MSADYTNDTRSGIVDGPSTMVVDGRLVKVLIWYDNEYGYAFRMVELTAKVAASLARAAGDVKLRNYVLVTFGYWTFTLTDGALRMLVLLHFNELGYSPVAIAFLFLAYEFMGILTNLLGGWVGARRGLNRTLVAGLCLQIVALVALTFEQPVGSSGSPSRSSWRHRRFRHRQGPHQDELQERGQDRRRRRRRRPVPARRDPHRLEERTQRRRVLPRRRVAVVDRLRRSPLGDGGAARRDVVVLLIFLNEDIGKSKKKPPLRSILSKSESINRLSAARFFLFGSRDIWFVVALPVFLADELGWSTQGVGGFLAIWVIGYGIVQSFAPRFPAAAARRSTRSTPRSTGR